LRAVVVVRVVGSALACLGLMHPAAAVADPYQQPIQTTTKLVIRSCVQKGTSARAAVVVRSDARTPTGRARLTRDGHLVGVKTLQQGSARFTLSTRKLTLGRHKVAASYLPPSGSNFQRSSASQSFTVKRSCAPPAQGGTGTGAGGHHPSGGQAYPGLPNTGGPGPGGHHTSGGQPSQGGLLPNTGGMAWWPLALALGCLGSGLALVASSRRRHHAR